ncbi:MAG: TSUP family transporter [Oscillospiraceae bacterium]|nr:TSUP family transporter [Oscillospiraceae bacterium]
MGNMFIKYLIVCPLVLIAGFIDAIAGGGGLISLPAYMIAGLPPHAAIATNKLSSSMGTSAAVFRYAREGYIPWRPAVLCAAFAIAGSSAGARLSLLVDDTALKIIMLVLLPVTAAFVLTSRTFLTEKEPRSRGMTIFLAVIVAAVIGAYDGFYGPGTGTFLILFLTTVARMRLTTANGITKAINFSSNISALTVFLIHGQAMITLGLAAGVFSIAGNYLGTRVFDKKGARAVKPVMLTVLAVFFVKVLAELLG